jgi:hypothetical protein
VDRSRVSNSLHSSVSKIAGIIIPTHDGGWPCGRSRLDFWKLERYINELLALGNDFTSVKETSYHTPTLYTYKQRRVPVRMPLDRVGRPGLLSQAGAVSMGSACGSHGYFGEVPATTSIFIANPTSDHIIIRAGARVGSIAPTHLDADVPLTIGAVYMQDNTSWVDFDKEEADMSPLLDTVATVRLAPADESTTPST